MSVLDNIKPYHHHAFGIPPRLLNAYRHMGEFKEKDPEWYYKQIDSALTTYNNVMKYIDDLDHKQVPPMRMEHAANIASCLIADAAAIHDCLASAGYQIGPFKYDYLKDKLFPVQPAPEGDKHDGSNT